MSHEPYQPVACSQYDLYEIAIMRGELLDLVWRDEQGSVHQAQVKPVGLQTRDGQEFLMLQCDLLRPDVTTTVRLDRIQHMNNQAL